MSDNCPAAGPRLIRTLRSRLATHRNEQGLFLIDVLIGMSLFVLIALIAIQAIGQFRLRGYEAGAISDARQVGTALEAGFADTAAYPALSADASELPGVNLTRGIEVRGYATDGSTVTFCAAHESGAWATWSSADGGIDGHGRKDAPAKCGGSEGGGGPVAAPECTVDAFPSDHGDGSIIINAGVNGDGGPCPSADASILSAFFADIYGVTASGNEFMVTAVLSGVTAEEFNSALDAWLAANHPTIARDTGSGGDDCDPTLGPC